MSSVGWPARFEVRVDGVLDGHWSQWFGGLQISSEGGESILSGTMPDLSALYVVLKKMTCAGTPSGSSTDDRAAGHMGGARRRSR
jgi:hypothetical protein